MQQVVGDDRLGHVELELAGLGRHRDRHVVADDLEADLVDDFGDDRIDLARHDRVPGCIGGRLISLRPAARPGRQQRRSLQIFEICDRGALERAGELRRTRRSPASPRRGRMPVAPARR